MTLASTWRRFRRSISNRPNDRSSGTPRPALTPICALWLPIGWPTEGSHVALDIVVSDGVDGSSEVGKVALLSFKFQGL